MKLMSTATSSYDETSDTLYISFEPGKKASGVELNDHFLLRIDEEARTAVGLTVFEYSLAAQETDLGPRSFPLTGLAQLSSDRRQLVVDLLLHPPVSDILSVSSYTPSAVETVPITSLRRRAMAAGAH